MLSIISITHQIQTSSCKFNPGWGKKNSSDATIPTQAALPKNPAELIDPKEEEKVVKLDLKDNKPLLPPVKTYGFILGDRDLHTSSGRHAFNQFLVEKTLRNSQSAEESFDTEMPKLENHAESQMNKFLYGNLEPLKRAARNKEITWNPGHIFTPTIEPNPAGYPMLTGFHHDPSRIVERSNIFEFRDKVEYEGGFYSAHIAIDPSNPSSQFRKTFFPASWNRKQVLDCILASTKNVSSKPTIYNNGVATEYIFLTPAKTKATSSDIFLAIGIRVFNNTGITSMHTVYPQLPTD